MDDFDTQRELINQLRARYASQAQTQMPQGQMVGGRFVAPHALQYLAAGLRTIGGMQGEQMANEQLTKLASDRQKATADALRNFGKLAQGTPDNVPGDGMGPVLPGQKPDMMAAYQSLLNAPDAGLRQTAMQGMAKIPELEAQRAAKADELKMRAEQRAQELQAQHQMRMEAMQAQNASREQMAEAQREFQREMAKMRIDANSALRSAVSSASGGPMGKPPAGYRFTPDGNLEAIPGGPAASKSGEKPLTEGQAKGALYLGQMRSASEELKKLPPAGRLGTAAASSTYTNWLAPEGAQKVAQLENQWSEAFLRAKTGAAATEGEVALNRRTFFPSLGDSDAVVKQKAKMREQAERDMQAVAGPGSATAGAAPMQNTSKSAGPKFLGFEGGK